MMKTSISFFLLFLSSFSLLPSVMGQLISAIDNPKVCQSKNTFAKTKAKIICKMLASDLNPEYPPVQMDCFQKLEATECKEVPVTIRYKLINMDANTDMTVRANGKTYFKFNDMEITSQVVPTLRDGILVPSDSAVIFQYETTVNTCQQIHLAEMKMKLKATDATETDRCSAADLINFQVLTHAPSVSPTAKPSVSPSVSPTAKPSVSPTARPTVRPSVSPSARPTKSSKSSKKGKKTRPPPMV